MKPEQELNNLRNEVRDIDTKLAELFERRIELSRAIGECKKKASLPIYDAKREEENIRVLSEFLQNEIYRPYFVKWYRELMDISKNIQKKVHERMK